MTTRIYQLSLVCLVLVAVSLIAPRFVSSSEGGFGAAATAVLVLLGALATAFLLSVYLFVVTVRHYRALGLGARVAGLVPAVVLGVGLAVLVGSLRY